MDYIINWCNDNSGFISAILSIMTINISVCALIVSRKIGIFPYRKQLAAIPTYYKKDGKPVIDIKLVNYGLTAIVIRYVAVLDSKKNWVGSTSMEAIILKPSNYKTISLEINDYNKLVEKYALDLNNRIVIEVCEFGGKKHKYKKGFPVG